MKPPRTLSVWKKSYWTTSREPDDDEKAEMVASLLLLTQKPLRTTFANERPTRRTTFIGLCSLEREPKKKINLPRLSWP